MERVLYFFRLLADGKLYAADSNLNKIENLYYPIIKVTRQSKEHKEPLFYKLEDKIYKSFYFMDESLL